MTEWELEQIFGPVDQLIPIHEGEMKGNGENQQEYLNLKNVSIYINCALGSCKLLTFFRKK